MCLDSMFGAPTGAEKAAQATESNIGQTMLGYATQQYAQQQGVLKTLNAQTSRIMSGNTGPGFSGAENATIISGIVNAGAAAARNAIQATQDRGAGQVFAGTGESGLARTSAIRQQVAGDIASKVSANTANALGQEQEANFAVGRQNAGEAAKLLSAQVGMYNPEGYMSGASSANQASFKMADTIRQEQKEATMGKLQFGAKLATLAGGGIMGGLGGGGLKGILGGLMGNSKMFTGNNRDNDSGEDTYTNTTSGYQNAS